MKEIDIEVLRAKKMKLEQKLKGDFYGLSLSFGF
jgi:hypothetical protein